MKKLLTVLLTLIFAVGLWAADVSGPQSGAWTFDNSPYTIVGDVEIPAGDTLTIDPGVEVDFSGRYRILVTGTMLAQGTAEDSIIFKHENPDSFHYGLDFLQEGTTSILEYCRIQDGRADGSSHYGGVVDYHGGGIIIESSSPQISHCRIIKNNGEFGAGIFIFGSSKAEITSSIISNNIAGNLGGGIGLNGSAATGADDPIIENNLIYGNRAANGGGISFYSNSDIQMFNNLFYGNHAGLSGGGLYINDNTNNVAIRNSVFWNNTSTNGIAEIADGGFPIVVENSDVAGGFPGTGNIDIDPQFQDPATVDFHVQATSPIVDAGTNTDAPAVDFDGNARPFDGDRNGEPVTDMGPYEYLNTAPQITSTPVESVDQDALYSYDVNAADPDAGEVLTYSLSTTAGFLSIDPNSGVVSGTPTNSDVGDYSVTVEVTDLNGAADTQDYTCQRQ
ncbi:MAG: putative Ig domain-containing protein [Calditrichia bacterium]